MQDDKYLFVDYFAMLATDEVGWLGMMLVAILHTATKTFECFYQNVTTLRSTRKPSIGGGG